MRPLHLNLAARPYRDYRPVWATVAAMALATLLLFINNVQTAYDYFVTTEATRGEIAELRTEAERERRKAQAAETAMRNVDVASLNLQTAYINAQIAERAFSWSELLDHLEAVVPKNVRLVSLDPTVTVTGQTRLRLNCVAKSSQGLVEILNNMLRYPHFSRPFPQSETALPSGLHQFQLSVDYMPAPRGLRE